MDHPYEIEFTDFLILCEEKEIPAGRIFEMHWHDYIEIELILSGEAMHIHNNEQMSVKRGHAHIITPHDYHAIHVVKDLRLIHICFESAILDKEIHDTITYISDKKLAACFSEDELEMLCRKLKQITLEEQSELPLRHVAAKSILHEFIVDILRHGDEHLLLKPTLAQKLVAYTSAKFQTELSIAEVAKAFSLSPNYVGRIFREQTGMSFHNYLNAKRLQYACNMLKYSSFPIKDIAMLSGYASIEYFFSVFKKRIGMTPVKYRISKQNISHIE